jgi:hypothetical protein
VARQPLPKKYLNRARSIANPTGWTAPKLKELIGACAAASAHVEMQFSLLMGSMLGIENAASVAVFCSIRNSRARREALEAAARHVLDGNTEPLFKAIMKEYSEVDSFRNDIVHGIWGQVEGVDDAVIWLSTENYAVWLINAYHEQKAPKEPPGEKWLRYCHLWKLSEIGDVVRRLNGLQDAIGNLHGYLRYRDQPAGKNALDRLQKAPFILSTP